jgi:hypothetical protein
MSGNDKAEESTTKSITEKNKVVTKEYSTTENGEKEQDNASGIESEELTEYSEHYNTPILFTLPTLSTFTKHQFGYNIGNTI